MNVTMAKQSLLEDINGAIRTFNDIFADVAPIDDTFTLPFDEKAWKLMTECTSNESTSDEDSVSPGEVGMRSSSSAAQQKQGSPNKEAVITRERLSSSHCERIKHISGYLISIKKAADFLYRLQHRLVDEDSISGNRNLSPSPDEELAKLRETLIQRKKHEEATQKKICALQDFLVNELNRAEAAENALKVRENELVQITEERNKYMKMVAQLQAGGRVPGNGMVLKSETGGGAGQNASENATAVTVVTTKSSQPNVVDLVGKYIRKKFGSSFFFGLVVAFDKPFYKVKISHPHSLAATIVNTITQHSHHRLSLPSTSTKLTFITTDHLRRQR
jgi:hypothetical protein